MIKLLGWANHPFDLTHGVRETTLILDMVT